MFRAGKIIVLKSEDTDVETNRKPKQVRRYRRSQKGNGDEANGSGAVSFFFLFCCFWLKGEIFVINF